MIAQQIINGLEERYPKRLAEDWDNVGLLLGDNKQEIKKVQLSLDITDKAIENAVKNGVNMIVTHHPFIFKGIKNIDFSTTIGKKIRDLIKNDISVYSIHTNLDSAQGGLNDYLLSLLDICESKVIDKNSENESCGIGRLYKLKEETLLKEYIVQLKERFQLENLRVIAESDEVKIKRVALINGSGMSYWRKVKSLGADLFITGDVGYHEALEAKESGLAVIDIGHFEGERHFVRLLKTYFEKINIDVIIYNDGPTFKIY